MFILWGKKYREEALGAVGEWCPSCRKVRVFTVAKYYRIWHLYYINVGSWRHVSTLRECWRCGSKYECRSSDFTAFLTEAQVDDMSLAEVVDRTNARMPGAMRPLATVAVGVCPHCNAEFHPAEDDGGPITCPACGREA